MGSLRGGQHGGGLQLPRFPAKNLLRVMRGGMETVQGLRGQLGAWPPSSLWGWRWFTWPCPPTGPSHWKELKATCGGSKQSPVNIDRRRLQRDSGLGDIVFEGYDQAPPGKWRLVNNGHTGGCSAPTTGSAPRWCCSSPVSPRGQPCPYPVPCSDAEPGG